MPEHSSFLERQSPVRQEICPRSRGSRGFDPSVATPGCGCGENAGVGENARPHCLPHLLSTIISRYSSCKLCLLGLVPMERERIVNP
ncbi:hypothetical protein C1H46_041025 [Malus baccata]|uniref:Uncharacterized protein n=1 Tax=Malus baccata TaxID=106549 RepID=A0A540KGX2_MALBA|nr:hypothetical protein C1H46_041025 [Malus baccata]